METKEKTSDDKKVIKNVNNVKKSKYKKFKQSANVLFNFMGELRFLREILKTKCISPRYCEEDMRYLKISDLNSIAFPMKCFCDINLSKLEKHRKLYGDYGIGLTKEWGIKKGVQPVLYLIEHSPLFKKISECLNDEYLNEHHLNENNFNLNAREIPHFYKWWDESCRYY